MGFGFPTTTKQKEQTEEPTGNDTAYLVETRCGLFLHSFNGGQVLGRLKCLRVATTLDERLARLFLALQVDIVYLRLGDHPDAQTRAQLI